MKRRNFITSVLALLAVPSVLRGQPVRLLDAKCRWTFKDLRCNYMGPIPDGAPVLYGDGIHDDTAALQAFIDGKPVFRPNGSPIKGRTLADGTYLCSCPLNMDTLSPCRLEDVTIQGKS